MAELINLTIDGVSVQAAPGTLVINAARSVGIEIPAFCYYEGLSLQAACRMCLVEVERMPKLQTACTLTVSEGMVVTTDSPAVVTARKSMLEFLLTNHPLDCPVCDKGGECELQDAVYRYGAGEGRFTHIKHHVDEKQFSPVVYYDAPRCILCYRCVRICDEGLGVAALGLVNRGVTVEIAPNRGSRLECDECGMCIDICPVGALTSGTYRYQTRPWEMRHVGTVCAHCGDGCKTTLGVRNGAITRANNRDRSGINGEFLCVKGRFAFDFVDHPERLQTPLLRTADGFEPVSWARALGHIAERFLEIKARNGRIGVVGSNLTTNEEDFFLQKFAREGLGAVGVDHIRTGDLPALVAALGTRSGAWASSADLYNCRAAVIVASDLSQQHPFLAFQLRANWRHHGMRCYTVTPGPVREDSYAVTALRAAPGDELAALESLREKLKAEPELVILAGASVRADALTRLVAFGDSLGIPVRYVCLLDYANSRGAADMGLLPDRLPGYRPAEGPGLALPDMLADPALDALWVMGADPLASSHLAAESAFVVVQDLFLTPTAARADVVLASASAYEKAGTVTSVCGEVQKLARGASVAGAKSDLEIMSLLAARMGLALGPSDNASLLEEICRSVPGYENVQAVLQGGVTPVVCPVWSGPQPDSRPDLIRSSEDTLFTSGVLGRYSRVLNSLSEAPGRLYR